MAIRDPHTASPFPNTRSSPLQSHPQRLRRIRTHLAVNCQPFSPLKSHYRIAGVDAEYVVCTFGAEAGIGEGVLYFAYFGGNHHGVGVAVNDRLGRGYNHRGRLRIVNTGYQDAIIPAAVGEVSCTTPHLAPLLRWCRLCRRRKRCGRQGRRWVRAVRRRR